MRFFSYHILWILNLHWHVRGAQHKAVMNILRVKKGICLVVSTKKIPENVITIDWVIQTGIKSSWFHHACNIRDVFHSEIFEKIIMHKLFSQMYLVYSYYVFSSKNTFIILFIFISKEHTDRWWLCICVMMQKNTFLLLEHLEKSVFGFRTNCHYKSLEMIPSHGVNIVLLIFLIYVHCLYMFLPSNWIQICWYSFSGVHVENVKLCPQMKNAYVAVLMIKFHRKT